MARIAIISDTHGSIANLYPLLPRIGSVDSTFHLGDVVSDVHEISRLLNTGCVAVRGNCDPYQAEIPERIVTWDSFRILLVHGHLYRSILQLSYKAESEQCQIVCYGHTHIASVERYHGILMINPGSLSLPRGGQKPSMAILTLSGQSASAEILHV